MYRPDQTGKINVLDINEGSSTGAVNFPEVSLRALRSNRRIMPVFALCIITWLGLCGSSTTFFSEVDINVDKQFSDSRFFFVVLELTDRGDVAYMIADISEVREDQIKDIYKKLSSTPFNIVTRMLY
jgi:D-3-phosphoglycerate dehydrogenase